MPSAGREEAVQKQEKTAKPGLSSENPGEKKSAQKQSQALLLCSHQGEEIPNVRRAVIYTMIMVRTGGNKENIAVKILLEKRHCGMPGVWSTAFWDNQVLLVF